MSGLLHGPTRRYLVDDEARDISRMLGIEWEYQQVHSKGVRRPFIDLQKLDPWMRFRVAWCLISGYHYLGIHTQEQ